MTVRIAKTRNEYLLDVVGDYLAQGGKEPIDLEDIARFAINSGQWKKHGSRLLQLCKQDFARAFREQYHTDLQGRQVRTYHAIRMPGENRQLVLWADMRTASSEHMEVAFQQRRNQIVGDCRQLKRDVDSFNENNPEGKYIQLVLDFTEDVAETEQPADYRPSQPR